MLFEINQPTDLMTPTIVPNGMVKVNPLFTSNGVLPTEENDTQFPLITSETNEYNLVTTDNTTENNDNNQNNYDLLSSFDFPVLTELEDLQFEKYLSHTSYPTNTIDLQPLSNSDESTFYAVDDSTSPWLGGECTVGSESAVEDMEVPPSPVFSTTSGSSSVIEKRVTKKRAFSTTERKLRKKDQNKAAAEKYRLKKKSERDELVSRHAGLKSQNQELKFQLDNLTFRLEQFKQLFVDVLQIPIPTSK
ncbi:unnamed protein product [Adineta ricciae]|uniref:BZIP domain-containing protein n=1 Tax=Adineta ricciae TaxID=249248 RepID=A0A813QNS2_ADIRI|nr:unnamed protein product [Adineta ricciae]CAF0940960.1 unnamed protein product [Adineta ricciae]